MKTKTLAKVIMACFGLYIGELKEKDWRQPETLQPGWGDTGVP